MNKIEKIINDIFEITLKSSIKTPNLHKQSECLMEKYLDYCIQYRFTYFIIKGSDNYATMDEVHTSLHQKFNQNGIEFGYKDDNYSTNQIIK